MTIADETTQSRTIYVDDDGTADYTSIQDAIDNASDGDTIFVYSGIYYEKVDINKSINLIGCNRNWTFIDGQVVNDVINITADYVNITGFTIQNATAFKTGIIVNSNFNTITRNIIKKNHYNINVYECGNYNTISSNIISGGVLELFNSNNNIIVNNTITDCDSSIHLKSSCNNILEGNNISNNYYGLTLLSSNNNSIIGNNITHTGTWGIYLLLSSNNIISCNNIIDNNGICIGYLSNKNTLKENNIDITGTKTTDLLVLYTCKNNLIYHNNIGGGYCYDWCNTHNNTWFNSSLKEGNFWALYHGIDENLDGVGDSSFNKIEGNSNNQDLYPLMYRYPDNKKPCVCEILSPVKYIYFNNEKIYQFFVPVIFGKIEIKVNAHDFESRIWKVEFCINDMLQKVDTSRPYDYNWDKIAFGKYIIKTIAYDNVGNQASNEIEVWKFF